jgi:hypothetical protein
LGFLVQLVLGYSFLSISLSVIIAISDLANMGDTQVYNYACLAIADMCLANGLQLHHQFAPENDTLPNQAMTRKKPCPDSRA